MEPKENILRKIRILITNQFDTPEEAFSFFDSDTDGRLKVSEIKRLLKDAEINGFIRGVVANELLKEYDDFSDTTLDWEEFKIVISALEKDLKF